jgi:hypothetical protein
VLKSAAVREFSIHVEGPLNAHPFQDIDRARETAATRHGLVNRIQPIVVAKA